MFGRHRVILLPLNSRYCPPMSSKPKPIRRLAFLLLIAGCADPGQPAAHAPVVTGRLENADIREASGLARSQRNPGILWIINDNDSNELVHAIDHAGTRLGEFDLKKSKNRDWEDLASFRLDDVPYLLIADVGDNHAKRRYRTLYIVEEPQVAKKQKATIAWRLDFSYPDGPRDVESVAIDVENQRVLILSKRDIPPRLYEIPLRPESGDRIVATLLGPVVSLPRPRREDVEFAPLRNDWYWQPTGMDISQDNLAAVIMTYRAVYYYERRPEQDWFEALNGKPRRISLGNFKNAEAVAFGNEQRTIFVTGENKHSRLLRIDLNGAEPRTTAVTVMSFNVQNLFDNADDPGKDDKAYLPIESKQNDAHIAECAQIEVESWRNECLHLDWSDDTIDFKLGVLAATIRQVNGGRGADIIAFQEVENQAILDRLRTEHLSDLGYEPAILIEGTDLRGIDVAFLTKLPLAAPPVLHPLDLPNFPVRRGDTRGVLQATFVLPDGSYLTGFSVHFPAPFLPIEMRVLAYEHLADLLDHLPDTHHAFAAGDFNTTSKEADETGLLDDYARPHWIIAHDIGCGSCLGSYFYHRDSTWSFLDMILFAPARGGKATSEIRADSVQIANLVPAQNRTDGTPQPFQAAERTGVSDHWPVIATIEFAEKQ